MEANVVRFSAKEVASIAIMVALLIGAQMGLSSVPGIELVTVLLLCFAYSFGTRDGMMAATAFSLICGILHGFDVKSFLLYLIYYNLFTLLFGLIGEKNGSRGISLPSIIATNGMFLFLIAGMGATFTVFVRHISVIMRSGITTISAVLFAVGLVGAIAYNLFLFLGKKKENCKWFSAAKVVAVTVTAAVCTICFTLLDDLLYPMFYGTWGETAVAYFYGAFSFMLPQTVCTVVSVGGLFLPLTKIFQTVAKKVVK